MGVLLPTLDLLELGFPIAELSNAWRQSSFDSLKRISLLAVGSRLLVSTLVSSTNFNFVEVVKQIEMGDEQRVDGVQPFSMLDQVQVSPAKLKGFLWQSVVFSQFATARLMARLSLKHLRREILDV